MTATILETAVLAAPTLALLALAVAAAALLAIGGRRNAGRRDRLIELLRQRRPGHERSST